MSKWLVGRYAPFEILAISGVIGTIISALWILIQNGSGGFFTPKWKWYMARGFVQCLSSICAIEALSRIPLADFYGIVFLTPMTTALLATFILGERIGIYRIFAIIFGFFGVLIIAGPSFESHNIGYAITLGTVLCASTSAILIRKIGHEPIPQRYVFFPFIICATVFLPLCLIKGFTMPDNIPDMFGLILYAPIAMIGVLGYSMGFGRARDTALIAPFHYTQMIWGVLIGYFIFNDIPSINTLVGSVIITLAGAVIIWRERVHHAHIASMAAETPI